MVIHLEQDILECEVKWALENIAMNKASGGDGISAELFKIPVDDAVKMLYSICQQIGKSQQWPQEWKMPVFISFTKKGNAKEYSNYHAVVFISYASKVMLKFLKLGFSSRWTKKFQMYKLDLEKAEKPETTLSTSAESYKMQGNSRKTSTSASLTNIKAFDCVVHNKLWETLKEMRIPDYLTCPWETCK